MNTTKKEKPTKEQVETKINIYNLAGEDAGSVSFPEKIMKTTVSPKLLTQYIRVYQTNQRQGNASTKTRSEVRGTTKKIYKQKGTGKARHGSQKAPIFKGGGVVGGPKPKNYKMKINKQQKRKALLGALHIYFEQGNIFSLSEEVKKEIKTKTIFLFLKSRQLTEKKVLFVLPLGQTMIQHSLQNLPKVSYTMSQSLNPFDILKSDTVIFVNNALDEFSSHFLKTYETN